MLLEFRNEKEKTNTTNTEKQTINILEMDELWSYYTTKDKETNRNFKKTQNMDDRNKVISIDENKNDNIVCRQLLEEIKGNSNINNNNIIKINIIAIDGNYSYDKVIMNKGYNRDYVINI